jgi:hypothetical protein
LTKQGVFTNIFPCIYIKKFKMGNFEELQSREPARTNAIDYQTDEDKERLEQALPDVSDYSIIKEIESDIVQLLGYPTIVGISSAQVHGQLTHVTCSFSNSNDIRALDTSLEKKGTGIFHSPPTDPRFPNEYSIIIPRYPLLEKQSKIHEAMLKAKENPEITSEQRIAYQHYNDYFANKSETPLTLEVFSANDTGLTASPFLRWKMIRERGIKIGEKVKLLGLMTPGVFKILKITTSCKVAITTATGPQLADPSTLKIIK